MAVTLLWLAVSISTPYKLAQVIAKTEPTYFFSILSINYKEKTVFSASDSKICSTKGVHLKTPRKPMRTNLSHSPESTIPSQSTPAEGFSARPGGCLEPLNRAEPHKKRRTVFFLSFLMRQSRVIHQQRKTATDVTMQIFLVGGAVRDQLLGYPYTEKDWVVVGATPEIMRQKGFTPVGKDFPVFLHPETKEEYALARTERKTGRGYAGFHFNCAPDISLEDDLRRRDLTINAMARSETGELIDPYGGAHDIEQKTLRHVSDAFREDPVRILRVARFAARYHHLGFTIAGETLELMREMVRNGEADHLVAERVWKEMARALTEKNPEVFIQTLRDCGALAVILPELDTLFGVPQPAQHHPEIDTGVHCLMVLRQACALSQSAPVRFAALMHDLGKGLTPAEQWPSHHGHEQAGVAVLTKLCQRLAVPNEYRDLALLVCEFHTHCHKALELKASTLNKLFRRLDLWRRPERLNDFLLACEADSRGRTGFENRAYPQTEFLRGAFTAASAITARELMAAGYSGAKLGQQLEQKRTEAIGHFQQTYRETQ